MIYSVSNAPWKGMVFGRHGFPLAPIAHVLFKLQQSAWEQILLDEHEADCIAMGFV